MNIGIIGGGAIGLLTAAYLGQHHDVHLYTRRVEQARALNNSGVVCNEIAEPVFVTAHLFEEGMKSHDLLILTVKQTQLAEVLQSDLPMGIPLLFLQNGMGHLNKVPLKSHRCWAGVVEHGAIKKSDTEVVHLGKGKIDVAGLGNDRSSWWVDELSSSDFPVKEHPDYWEMLTSKMMINTVINPLTALFQVQNKMIIQNPSLRKIAEQLCQEACDTFDKSVEKEWKRITQVALNTGENQSSMLKDILNGRKTEIEAINGYVLEQSKSRLPYHQFVVDAIHALEEREEGS